MKKKGFTIIELIVVIVIVGILSLLAIPAFRGLFMKGRLEEARNQVIAFYQSVNRYAASEGVSYILEVDADDNSLRCMREGLPADVKEFIDLSSKLDLTGANITFTVQADGFVRDNDGVRKFSIYDSDTRNTLEFYISPLGVMEVNKK